MFQHVVVETPICPNLVFNPDFSQQKQNYEIVDPKSRSTSKFSCLNICSSTKIKVNVIQKDVNVAKHQLERNNRTGNYTPTYKISSRLGSQEENIIEEEISLTPPIIVARVYELVHSLSEGFASK